MATPNGQPLRPSGCTRLPPTFYRQAPNYVRSPGCQNGDILQPPKSYLNGPGSSIPAGQRGHREDEDPARILQPNVPRTKERGAMEANYQPEASKSLHQGSPFLHVFYQRCISADSEGRLGYHLRPEGRLFPYSDRCQASPVPTVHLEGPGVQVHSPPLRPVREPSVLYQSHQACGAASQSQGIPDSVLSGRRAFAIEQQKQHRSQETTDHRPTTRSWVCSKYRKVKPRSQPDLYLLRVAMEHARLVSPSTRRQSPGTKRFGRFSSVAQLGVSQDTNDLLRQTNFAGYAVPLARVHSRELQHALRRVYKRPSDITRRVPLSQKRNGISTSGQR